MEAWSVLSRLLPLILLAGASGWGNAAEARYTITDFGPKTSAVRINAAGEVTGTRSLPSGDFRAFLFSRGQLHDLGTLGGASSVPTGLNDDGTVVGNSRTSEQGPNGNPVWRPFVYKGGVMRELTVIGLNSEVRLDRIFDINNGGVVVGLTDERPRRLCIVSDGRATVAATLAEYTPPDFISGLEIKRINAAGQIIGGLISIMGVVIIAVPAGIVASGFTEEVEERRQADVARRSAVEGTREETVEPARAPVPSAAPSAAIDPRACPHCGKPIAVRLEPGS